MQMFKFLSGFVKYPFQSYITVASQTLAELHEATARMYHQLSWRSQVHLR